MQALMSESCPTGCSAPHYDEAGRLECYYAPDGALVLTVQGIRTMAADQGLDPAGEFVGDAIDAALEGWDAVVDLAECVESRPDVWDEKHMDFLHSLAYSLDGPTFDGRAIRVEAERTPAGA